MLTRRQALCLSAGTLALPAMGLRAQTAVPITDMHSHYGLFSRSLPASGLAEEMRAQGVAFIAWKAVPDSRWLALTPSGVEPSGVPERGALAAALARQLGGIRSYIDANRLVTVLTRADVDRCVAGEPGIVLSSEGADFLEGDAARLAPAYEAGLRVLQLVHYLPTPVGDRQTGAPTHQGLSALGKAVVEESHRLGILVDLAHTTPEGVEQALALSPRPVIWSHGWIGNTAGRPNDRFGYLQRRLSLAHARRIAERGGVIGVWALGLPAPGGTLFRGAGSWPVGRGDTEAYAKELLYMVEQVGRDAVALGTDIEGMGPNWAVNDYTGVRRVLEHLVRLKTPTETIERIAYGNFARVLKASLSA